MMIFVILALLGVIVSLALFTHFKSNQIKETFPPIGDFVTIDGMKVHYIDRAGASEDAPVLVFLHGASGNLRDADFVFGEALAGKARLIMFDRPGHGWSERKDPSLSSPVRQAEHVVKLLDHFGISKAFFFGHSWGGALALTLAVDFPERVQGLILSAPVAYPWPGGINWYYPIAAKPVIGELFARLLVVPVGLRQVKCATAKVFWPDPIPENYDETVGTETVLVPERFRDNAADIAHLRAHVEAYSPRYAEIKAPVVILNGKKDQILLPWVHAERLRRTLPNIEVIDLPKSGHMPHHSNVERVKEALDKMTALEKV